MRRFITFAICAIILITGIVYAKNNHWLDSPTAFAVGDLTVNWGVPEGQPIFTISNAAPGFVQTKTVQISNGATTARPLGIRAVSQSSNPANFPTVLKVKITEGITTLYQKTLQEFYSDSVNPNGVLLGNINSGATRTLNIEMTFDTNAGNAYQNANITFNLTIGMVVDIPLACQGMHFTGSTIYGTDGNDNLRGTNKSEMIVLFGGNDNVSSGNGEDCIVGGDGNKNVNSGNGRDAVVLGNGNSSINTGNSDDIVKLGNGNNSINTGNGDDIVNVGSGKNNVNLGNGNDKFKAFGGDNNISGGNGNDNIDNGTTVLGTISGGNGNDTCVAKTKSFCEH